MWGSNKGSMSFHSYISKGSWPVIAAPPIHSNLSLFSSFTGGAEQRQAQLGASKRGASRPDHGGGHTDALRDQDEESLGGGQEASGARGE